MDIPVLAAFDPGTRRLGWTVGDGFDLPTSSAWRFEQCGDDLGLMLHQIDEKLCDFLDEHRPEAVAYESPILTHFDKLQSVRKTFSLGAHIEFVCHRRDIPCFEVDLRAVKKELAGIPGASKADMVYAAEKLGVVLPITLADGREDAADSLGVWLLLLRAKRPRLSAEFDRVLWGARGALL